MPEAISNLPEWPQHELLASEKELLGFYVTGDPLTPLAPLLQKYSLHTTVKLSELENRSMTRIGGMIAAVTHGTSKKSGKPYSMVTLEDLDGSVQLLVMNDYDKFRPLLELNQPILVVGEVSTGEDRPKIFPQEIMPLGDAAKKYTKQVHLRLPMAHLQPEDMVKAFELTSAHPGKCPLFLVLLRPEGGSVFIETNSRFSVTPSLELEHEVHRLFGDKSYYAVVDKSLPEKPAAPGRKKVPRAGMMNSSGTGVPPVCFKTGCQHAGQDVIIGRLCLSNQRIFQRTRTSRGNLGADFVLAGTRVGAAIGGGGDIAGRTVRCIANLRDEVSAMGG